MTLALDIIATILIGGGSFFCVVGAIGLLRLRGFYSRCHAAGVTDSAGAAGILVGLCFVSEPLIAFKLLTILVFLWLSSVASTHALVKAAYARGIKLHEPIIKDWTHLDEEEADDTPADTTEGAPS